MNEILNKITIFTHLPEKIKDQLSEIVISKTVTKGEVLFHEASPAEAVYFVNEGKVKISKSTPDGKEILLSIRQPGEMFAEVALFKEANCTYPATASVIENGAVSLIRNEELELFLYQHPELGMAIFRVMAERLQISQATLRDVALYGKLGALATTLVRLTEDYGEAADDGVIIKLKLTHEDLGSFFGATRESVTRMMNQLKQQGILNKHQGNIIINDLDGLKTYITN